MTIFLLVLWITGLFQDWDEITSIILILLILWVFLGFGAFACISTKYTEKEPAKVIEVLRGKHIVVVSTVCDETKNNINTFESNEIETISDSTKYYWLIEYNYYNFECGRKLKFK